MKAIFFIAITLFRSNKVDIAPLGYYDRFTGFSNIKNRSHE